MWGVKQSSWARNVLSHKIFTGISKKRLGALVVELAPTWVHRCESGRRERRGKDRVREEGGGHPYFLVFTDRVLITLVHMRTGLSQAGLAQMFGCSQASVSRAVGEILPLLASRGFTTPCGGPKLHTLADVFAYATAKKVKLRIDGTEIQVRRPKAGRKGRKRFVSGKKRANTIKVTVVCDGAGNLLWAGAVVPGRMHDQTAVKMAGIDSLLDFHPDVVVMADNGYRGVYRDHPEQVIVPPTKPPKDAPVDVREEYERARHEQSSARIPVEHSIAKIKWWKQLQRWTGVRDSLEETIVAVACLASEGASA